LPEHEILLVLILGVLLPSLLGRRVLLTDRSMTPHIRQRWNIAYTRFAFAGASFVYTTAVTLLRPSKGFP
jgi:hypothetical protein